MGVHAGKIVLIPRARQGVAGFWRQVLKLLKVCCNGCPYCMAVESFPKEPTLLKPNFLGSKDLLVVVLFFAFNC